MAEETCDRIGIILQGRLMTVGTLEELRERAGAHANAKLESIFLKLTGADEVTEMPAALTA